LLFFLLYSFENQPTSPVTIPVTINTSPDYFTHHQVASPYLSSRLSRTRDSSCLTAWRRLCTSERSSLLVEEPHTLPSEHPLLLASDSISRARSANSLAQWAMNNPPKPLAGIGNYPSHLTAARQQQLVCHTLLLP
jgi:hypothetical protein